MSFRIYALRDVDDQIRYIGSTQRRLPLRLAWHVGLARRGGRAPVAVWIRQLLADGARPRITRIGIVSTPQEAASIESAWIRFAAEQGAELLNVRDRVYIPTYEHRRSISASLRGRRASIRTRFRMSSAQQTAWRRRRAA